MSERENILFHMKGPHIVTLDDGTRIDLSHCYEVWKARKARGMSVKEVEKQPLPDYPLIGRTLRSREDGDEYLVESASKQWWGGWYIVLLIQCNGSHAVRYWENINCYTPTILKAMEEAREDLEVLPIDEKIAEMA